jgi:hypothetical protein
MYPLLLSFRGAPDCGSSWWNGGYPEVYTPGFAADLFAVRVLPDWRILAGTLLAISAIPGSGLISRSVLDIV